MTHKTKSDELAQLLGVSRRRVQQLTKDKILTSEKDGRDHLYDPQQAAAEYEAYIKTSARNDRRASEKEARARALTGTQIGVLTVDTVVGRTASGDLLLRCRCECGNVREFRYRCLMIGTYRSCGGTCKLKSRRETGKN